MSRRILQVLGVSNSGTTSSRDIGFLPARSTNSAWRASTGTFNRSSTDRVIETMRRCKRRLPGLVLDGSDGAEGIHHSSRVVGELAVAGGAPILAHERRAEASGVGVALRSREELFDRGRMDVGVISNVHHETVESVRTHRRQQRIDRGATCLLRSGADQGFANQLQVILEGCDVRVRSRLLLWPTGIARCHQPASRIDARRHEGELESKRLVGVALSIRCPDRRQPLAVAAKRFHQCIQRRRHGRRQRQPLRQIVQRFRYRPRIT